MLTLTLLLSIRVLRICVGYSFVRNKITSLNFAGGTFALYTLLCQNSRIGLLNTAYPAHEHVSSSSSEISTRETRTSLLMKDFFERFKSSRIVLLLLVLLGTSMVVGDGILTPTMSGMSYSSIYVCTI